MEQPTVTIPESEYLALRKAAETLEQQRARWRARRQAYRESEKGKAAQKRYTARQKAARAALRAQEAREAEKAAKAQEAAQ